MVTELMNLFIVLLKKDAKEKNLAVNKLYYLYVYKYTCIHIEKILYEHKMMK